MSTKNTLFYRANQSVSVDFSSEEISSDGSLILLEKLERDHKLLIHFSKLLPDNRNPKHITYSREQQLKQRVFMLMLGYEDANDPATPDNYDSTKYISDFYLSYNYLIFN